MTNERRRSQTDDDRKSNGAHEIHHVLINVQIDENRPSNRESNEIEQNRNGINDGASGSGSRSGTSRSSDQDDDSHLINYPEDDDSKDNYDMDDDDDDNADETQLFLVTKGQTNDLEDCDYFSDGDGIDDEREEILKCVNGDGFISKLFAGLYLNHFTR